jgi:CRP/FNR family transcriptional regulator, dissimilatory nitrate respiration regulator
MSASPTKVKLEELQESPFGKRMGEEICKDLLAVAERMLCKTDDIIFEIGDQPEGVYLVLQGQVKLIRSGPGYREHIVHLAERHAMFGEASLFLEEHPVSSVALQTSELVFLPRDGFLEVLDRHPLLQRYIFGVMAHWMTLLVEKIDQLTLCDGAQRLAHYLVDLHEKSPYSGYMTSAQVELPTRKRDLATMLNMNQPSLSRILRQLQDQDLIEVQGRRLVLKDLEALRAMTRLPKMQGGVRREDSES